MMAILWIVILVFVYITLYVLNHRTPEPEGCEEIQASEGCRGCGVVDCKLRK